MASFFHTGAANRNAGVSPAAGAGNNPSGSAAGLRRCALLALALASAGISLAAAPPTAPAVNAELHPPPISLKVPNETSVQDLAAALQKATGARVEAAENGIPNSAPDDTQWLSLDLKDKVFWEVMLAINAHHPIRISWSNGFQFSVGEGMGTGVIAGNFLVMPTAIGRAQEADYQAAGAPIVRPETTNLYLRLAADPRVRVAARRPMRLLAATDDRGNSLAEEQKPRDFLPAGGSLWGDSLTLKIPEARGTKIASLKGELNLLVGVGEKPTEVPDLENMKEPLQLSRQTVRVTATQAKSGVRFTISADARYPDPAGLDQFPLPLLIRLVDATGEEKWKGRLTGGQLYVHSPDDKLGGDTTGLAFKPPLRMIVSEPDRLVEVKEQFEVKDIPLP